MTGKELFARVIATNGCRKFTYIHGSFYKPSYYGNYSAYRVYVWFGFTIP